MGDKEIYQQAEGFYFAMHVLKRRTMGELKAHSKGIEAEVIGPTHLLWAPQWALLAFSLELYFKALIMNETGKYPRNEHDLQVLFLKLSDTTQASIRNEYENCPNWITEQRAILASQGVPVDFDNCLLASRKAFIQQRYAFESESKGGAVLLEDIVSSVRSHIFRNHENWKISVAPIDLRVPMVAGSSTSDVPEDLR